MQEELSLGAGVSAVSGTTTKASSLIGRDVLDPAGEELGEINDLMLDLASGEVRYAVLGFGGFLGLDEKLFAIPLNAFELDSAGLFDDRRPSQTLLAHPLSDRCQSHASRGDGHYPVSDHGVGLCVGAICQMLICSSDARLWLRHS